jgi:signal transduction histidine kinase
VTLPLTYQGATVGELLVAPRAGEALGAQDRRLLDDLARQAGVAVHAVQLTTDLQRSRERIVTAREEERRRLRRDLHDGLGPRLAGLTLRIETARDRLAHDPVADKLLGDLSARMEDAVGDIRRLVYGLRPPALDDLGLVGAIRQVAGSYDPSGLEVDVDAPEALPPLPAATEVAAYWIAQEALTNVVRHARAGHCFVVIVFDDPADTLTVTIEDDGIGLSPERRSGVGLQSMRERGEELGGTLVIESLPTGGTRVRATLPCRWNDLPEED